MTLLSLAPKQIWPQVLTKAHLKPERLFLLHSEDMVESKGPAQRLKRFFDDSRLVPGGATRLEPVPHDDFSASERRIQPISEQTMQNLLPVAGQSRPARAAGHAEDVRPFLRHPPEAVHAALADNNPPP